MTEGDGGESGRLQQVELAPVPVGDGRGSCLGGMLAGWSSLEVCLGGKLGRGTAGVRGRAGASWPGVCWGSGTCAAGTRKREVARGAWAASQVISSDERHNLRVILRAEAAEEEWGGRAGGMHAAARRGRAWGANSDGVACVGCACAHRGHISARAGTSAMPRWHLSSATRRRRSSSRKKPQLTGQGSIAPAWRAGGVVR